MRWRALSAFSRGPVITNISSRMSTRQPVSSRIYRNKKIRKWINKKNPKTSSYILERIFALKEGNQLLKNRQLNLVIVCQKLFVQLRKIFEARFRVLLVATNDHFVALFVGLGKVDGNLGKRRELD